MDNAFYAVKARRLVGNDDTTEGQPGWPCWIICRKDGTFIWGTYGHYDRLWDDAMDYLAFQGLDVSDEEAIEAWWERHRFTPKFAGQVGVHVHSHWSAQYRHSWMIDYEKTELNDPNQHTNRYDVFLAPYGNDVDQNRFRAFTGLVKFVSDERARHQRGLSELHDQLMEDLNTRPPVYECERCKSTFRTGTRGPIPKLCATCRR